jgi:hypothetical protein
VPGADLYDVGGKHIGQFIEIAGNGDQIAIRHDGLFVWHRQLVAASAVAAVLPDHGRRGAVVLNVAEEALAASAALDAAAPGQDEDRPPDKELTAMLQPYVAGREHELPSRAGHLLFVATPSGYRLIERDGPPPAALERVSVPGHDDTFRVLKVAASPLPDDRRMCAYLERS